MGSVLIRRGDEEMGNAFEERVIQMYFLGGTTFIEARRLTAKHSSLLVLWINCGGGGGNDNTTLSDATIIIEMAYAL